MKIYVPEEEEKSPTYPTDTSPMDPRAKLVFFVILPILFIVLIGSIYFGVKGGEYQSFGFIEPLKKFANQLDKSFRDSFKIDGKFPRPPEKLPESKTRPSATPAMTKVPSTTPTVTPARPQVTVIPTQTYTQPQYRYVSPTPFVFPTIPPGALGSKEWEEEFNKKFEEARKRIEEANQRVREQREEFCNDNPTSQLCK